MAADASLYFPFSSNFIITILESDIPKRVQAQRREAYYITELNACSPPGYNQAPGETTKAWWWRHRNKNKSLS
jgi:hypothetical protein